MNKWLVLEPYSLQAIAFPQPNYTLKMFSNNAQLLYWKFYWSEYGN